ASGPMAIETAAGTAAAAPPAPPTLPATLPPDASPDRPPDKTRLHILDAAEDLIRRRGMEATTTRAIAERAGCAEGTIYRHFPDKHALLCEIVDATFPAFHALLDGLAAKAGTGDVRVTLEELGAAALG